MGNIYYEKTLNNWIFQCFIEKRFVLDEFVVLQFNFFFFNELNNFILDLIYTCVYDKETNVRSYKIDKY